MPAKLEDLFKCNDLTAFADSIVEPMNFTGYSQSDFYTCEYHGARFLVKMCFYRKSAPELYGKVSKTTMSQVDAEIKTLNLLKKNIIKRGLSPCILEVMYSKVCNKLKAFTESDNDSYNLASLKRIFAYHADMIKNGIAHPQYAFVVLERCDMTFQTYLHKSLSTSISFAVFKTLFFQILHTLYVLNDLYPQFQHGDLHVDNIMIKLDRNYELQPASMKYHKFGVTMPNGKKRVYHIPFFGLLPKIIDFGFTRVPEEGIISNVVADKILIYHRVESDIITFMASIYSDVIKQASHSKLMRVVNLFDLLDPSKSYSSIYPYIAKKHKHPTPAEMILNPTFDEYLIDVPDDRIIGEYNL